MNDSQPDPRTNASPQNTDASEAELAERLEQGRIPPELREWVLQQFPREEFLRALQEVQEKGGVEISDLLDEGAQPESKDGEHA
jgi:hypothetical protein